MHTEMLSLTEWHKKQAVDLFNKTWDLIDKGEERTDEETFLMIHMAHASRYHWTEVGEAVHLARGEWQISRVYALLGMGEQALLHGQYSLDLCLDNNIKDFDLAFGYEAIARAAALLKDEELYEGYVTLAKDAAEGISDSEDKAYFFEELKAIVFEYQDEV